MRAGRVAVAWLALPLAGCQGWQSALDPQGPEARDLAGLFWLFTIVLAIVWVLTMVAVAAALRRRRPEGADPLALDPAVERRFTVAVSVAVGATAVIVLVLAGVSFGMQRRLFAAKEEGLTITVTGRQWWWEVRYEDREPDKVLTTANEIHIPVGEPVTIKLESADVIHSLWVPNLMGKMDLIPGRRNSIRFAADREGVYRGQCAEFCGWQHAHMGLVVVAASREAFDLWRAQQARAAEPPGDPERRRGLEIFLSRPCVMCHAVRGTPAGGRVAPDLTHLASRRFIAAATLPMSRGNLAAWIVDPQGIKPGAHMPLVKLEPGEIHPLVSFLEGLR